MVMHPGRLDRARREVAVLRRLGEQPVPCAPVVLGALATGDEVVLALEEGTPLPDARDLSTDDWVDVAVTIAAAHRVGHQSLGLDAVERRRHLPGSLPLVLEHGDCHLDNVVRDATGRLLLIDWQEARIGDGLGDLVFTWQRAEFSGARAPRRAMTRAYADARGMEASDLVDGLDRTELRLLREDWPPFLALGDDVGRAALGRRLDALTRALDRRTR